AMETHQADLWLARRIRRLYIEDQFSLRRHSMVSLRRLALIALFFSLLPLWAQTPAPKPELKNAIDTLFAARKFDQTAISPDGKLVAWVESIKPGSSAIYIAPAAGGQPRRITAGAATGAYSEDSIAWSPDSKRLAFLSDAAKRSQNQLYVIS